MIRLVKIAIFLLLYYGSVSALEIRVEPESRWLDITKWETPYTYLMLIESSLTASGLKGEKLDQYRNRYVQILEKFRKDRKSTFHELTPYEQGEFILKWAHNNILKQYLEKQTLMDNIIDTGRYNCVSSSTVYLILCRDAGLTAGTIETSDHAFCFIETEKGPIDVETTTAFGFDPGVKREFQQSFNQTGYTYVPPGNYRNRDRISDKEIISLILQNRMSLLQKYNQHDQAIGLAVDRWTLAANEKNRIDMNDSFRNWAAVLNNKGNYKEAYNFISKVSEMYNLINLNRDLLYDLAYNQIITLTNTDKYDDAKIFLLETAIILNNSDQKNLEALVTRDYLADIVRNGSYDKSLPLIRNAFNSGNISKSEWKEWITVLHQNRALTIAEDSGWWNAWQFLKSLPEEERTLSSILNSADTAHDNWSFEIHNRFADLFNTQNFDKAEQTLLEALLLDPGNKYLSKDLSDLKKMNH